MAKKKKAPEAQAVPRLEAGMEVMVYEDPTTQFRPEGKATLARLLQREDNNPLEEWGVKFGDRVKPGDDEFRRRVCHPDVCPTCGASLLRDETKCGKCGKTRGEDHSEHTCVDELVARGRDALQQIYFLWRGHDLDCATVKYADTWGLGEIVTGLENISDTLGEEFPRAGVTFKCGVCLDRKALETRFGMEGRISGPCPHCTDKDNPADDFIAHVIAMADDVHFTLHPEWHAIVEEARAVQKKYDMSESDDGGGE